MGKSITLVEILEKIDQYELPHIVENGDTIPPGSLSCVGHIDGVLPEVVLKYDPSVGVKFNNLSEYEEEAAESLAKRFALLVGEQDHQRFIVGKMTKPFKSVSYANIIECHAFHDPARDKTHYFIVPMGYRFQPKG